MQLAVIVSARNAATVACTERLGHVEVPGHWKTASWLVRLPNISWALGFGRPLEAPYATTAGLK